MSGVTHDQSEGANAGGVPVDHVHGRRAALAEQSGPFERALPAADDVHAASMQPAEVDAVAGVLE
ncbi:MAG: hypothetical protein ACRELC_09525, partial [Gemmatimonadota bacterium]